MLAMGREFPVGIRTIRCRTNVTIAEDERGERAQRLLRSAERYCVVLDTLRTGVNVDAEITVRSAA
jgi:organic hydroperoxide reductase OsmC/OhrA